MLQKITVSWLLAFVVLFTSCVSSKKYKAATSDAAAAHASYDSLLKKSNDLQTQLNDAIASNKMVVSERDRYQKEGDSARSALSRYQGAVDKYTGGVDELQKKVADKLADYADRGVMVQQKDGMVHVGIEDQLLYRKGTNRVSSDGETVLGTLASVLNEDPNLKIMVISHTDDRPARGSDSWSASTERSNAVVRKLKDSKIDPARLTSAGQGQYNAIADNSTAEGRAQNRRTDIVLMPAAFEMFNKQ